LSDLDREITEEVKAVVLQMPLEKAPGFDGWAFYRLCWDTLKADVVAAIKDLFALMAGCWNLLNSANIVLIAKKEGAQQIGDYRLISIMHNMDKLLGKILANKPTGNPPRPYCLPQPECVHQRANYP
jgi:hypothetical protein